MRQRDRFTASPAAVGRIARRSAAVLGAFALVATAGSTVAEAMTEADPTTQTVPAAQSGPAKQSGPSTQTAQAVQWTRTPMGRQNATVNDIDAHFAGTWAVGSDLVNDFEDVRPVAFRWLDGRWKQTPQPVRTNSTLEAVAVAGANDVWAVGENRTDPEKTKPLVMHWDGKAWKVVPAPAVPTGSFDDVAVGPDGTLWMTGWANIKGTERAVVYQYAKGKWKPLTAGLEQAINGNTLTVLSKTDAWLGLNAGMAHFDGKTWKLSREVPTDGSQIPTGMVAAGPKNIWAVGVYHSGGPTGELPLALHYDGKSWKRVAVPKGSAQLYDVALYKGRPVAVGERFEKTGDVVVEKPLVLEHNGSSFVNAASPTTSKTVGTLTSVDVSRDRLWTGGLLSSTSGYSPFAAFGK